MYVCGGDRVSRTLSIVLNVRGWRRIGMGVRRLSTWVVRGRISSTRKRTSGIIDRTMILDDVRSYYQEAERDVIAQEEHRALSSDRKGWAGRGLYNMISSLGWLPLTESWMRNDILCQR